ncbi:hypothetical protein [Photobacterium minamisatsumaniensis]|uniref:hypothetical protein n=1 Tax=Photobacterium minamisatsumaniensis TaxID=2910233 RepID=UPI003D127E60
MKKLAISMISILSFNANALVHTEIEDSRIPTIKSAVESYNAEFKQSHSAFLPDVTSISNSIGSMINTAVITGNQNRMLSNCSLNATGMATRQTTANTALDAEQLIPDTQYHFWGSYSPTVEQQLIGISEYLSKKAPQSQLTLATPNGSQWYDLNQKNVPASDGWKAMNQYQDGTRFVVGIGLMDELIRDNSHYIYAEKINGEVIFIDGQTNLSKDIPPTYLTTQFDFSHLDIPLVTGLIFWALEPTS